MINRLRHFLENFRTLSVFSLILGFLVLGSCPLKKSIQVILGGSVPIEHTNSQNKNKFSSAVCSLTEGSFIDTAFLPERQAEVNTPLFIAIFFTAFWAAWALFKSDTLPLIFRNSDSASLDFVPLYLKNSVFLI